MPDDITILLARLQALEVLVCALVDEASTLATDRSAFVRATLDKADKSILRAMATAPKEAQGAANAARETLKLLGSGLLSGRRNPMG